MFGTMKSIISLLSILGFVTTALADSQFKVSVKKCTGDTDYFKVDKASLSCDSSCTWGSEATIVGTYTIGNTLSTVEPVITASLWGASLFNDTVDICHGDVSNDYGDECPDVGTYEFYTTTDLPGSPSSWYKKFSSWLSLKVVTSIDFGDTSVQCNIHVEGQNMSSYSSMIIGSAVIALGLFSFNRRSRHRAITLEELEGPEIEGTAPSTGFVKMSGKGFVEEGAMC